MEREIAGKVGAVSVSVGRASLIHCYGMCRRIDASRLRSAIRAPLWKTQTILAPINRWRNSRQFSKRAVQLRCIAKPYRERHVRDR